MNRSDSDTRLRDLSPAKRSLLEQRLKQSAREVSTAQSIPRREDRQSAPLSFAQQRLWFLSQLEPERSSYNEANAIRLVGPLDVQALQSAFNQLMTRHEVLRTTINMMDGEPRQIVHNSIAVALPVIDLRATAPSDRDAQVHMALLNTIRRPFDLSRDLPMRVLLVRLDDQEHILLKIIHHIATDGWSSGIVWRELGKYYRDALAGTRSAIAELPVQYQDYAEWQRQWLRGEVLDEQLSYWKKQLDAVESLQLPYDRKRRADQKRASAKAFLDLDADLTESLRAFSKKQGVTSFMTLLAAFQTLLHRYCSQDDIVVGSPIAGRTRPEVEGLIGFFVNTLVLRTSVAGDPTFQELLARVRDMALGAYAHQDVPFEKLVEELNPVRGQDASPLFQVLFAYQNVPRAPIDLAGLEIEPFEVSNGEAKVDLFLAVLDHGRGLRLRIEYATDLFDGATVGRMLGHFRTLLEGIVSNPERRISELPLLTESERRQLLVEWNDTKTDYPKDQCIHEVFETQVQKTPDAVVLVLKDQQLTYRELNNRANQLAHYLRRLGVDADGLVGLCLDRSLDRIVAMLGILKAGGAYVPLDPSYPRDRLAFMIQDTQVSVILTDVHYAGELPPSNARVIGLDQDWKDIGQEVTENPQFPSTPDHLAYVMYTSGSTGRPKGVEVTHRGITRLLFGGAYAQLDADQTILQLAPVTFDASTFEIWGALLHGGKCVLYPERVPSPQDLGEIINQQGVTTLWLTASLFNTVIDEAPQALSEVRQLLIGGESLSVPHVRRGLERLPHTEIVNGYGPTESTTFACCYRIPRRLDENIRSIPIGKPIGNTRLYILDRQMIPVPIGVVGEIYIGGDGLARGYFHRPELTAERFIAHYFDGEPSQRLYRTGDLGRYLPDGNIEYLGRTDNQVKVRGFRIELGEIEAVLAQHPAIQQAMVLAREDTPGDRRLVAYCVATDGSSPSGYDLRSFLQQKLPDYMMPSVFVFLDSLPLTPNGKLDRKALPAPDQSRPELDDAFAAPRTPIEEILANIWAGVLKLDKVGIHDNFFHLGGHSLLGTQVVTRIRDAFKLDLPLRTLFEAPTIHGLAQKLQYLRDKHEVARTAQIAPVAREQFRIQRTNV